MHYYKRNIGDYHKKAGRLSILQHGVYALLIDAIYDREKFPTLDDAVDWVWASTEEEVSAVAFVLKKFFEFEDGVYVQNRISEEIQRYQENSATNKRIAIEREAKRREKSTKREQSVNEAPPNHKPLTNNQEPITKFSFKNELIGLGVDESIADDWLTVRKKKRASNTQTALNGLINQIEKTSLSTNEVIKLCVENSWSGFKADYIKDEASNIPYEKIMELFNKHCSSLNTCFDLTANRKRGIAEIWNADTRHQEGKFWVKYLSTINSSADITNQWENSADYAFNYKTFVKLMESTC
jgi:uncharacterized protein YdaU (DUF1376 family)